MGKEFRQQHLDWYISPQNRVLLVGVAKLVLRDDKILQDINVESVQRAHDVVGLGGGIYDVIVFPKMPPQAILEKSFKKVYWGGYVIVLGIDVEGVSVVKGDPGILVLRRPPLPDPNTEEFYLEVCGRAKGYSAQAKTFHPRYQEKFDAIDFDFGNMAVADYGCGRGEIARLAALGGAEKVYALDVSPAAVALTKRFCDDLDNVEVICGSALVWESPRELDAIVAIDFVEHFSEDDLPTLFSRMRGNLKFGGMVHIMTPLGGDHVRGHKWAPTPNALKEKMEAAGFREKTRLRPEGSRKFHAEFLKED